MVRKKQLERSGAEAELLQQEQEVKNEDTKAGKATKKKSTVKIINMSCVIFIFEDRQAADPKKIYRFREEVMNKVKTREETVTPATKEDHSTYLDSMLFWIVCKLHTNELKQGRLLNKTDGKTCREDGW